jgi:zinc/manganese transport system ATP-binding protein
MTAIDLRHTTLALGGRTILRDVDLSIEHGEFIGVLGPNGAGKTTLMRALLGLVPPASGTMRVLGSAPTRGNPAIGYMPQTRTTASARLSGWDFVACTWRGDRWGLPWLNATGRADVARVLDLVGASSLARRPLGELSGGERQRLLLAQALLGSPRLLLLDEPLISLDPHRQGAVVALVRQVQRDLGLTVLFSAHDLNPLIGAMDRVLYLGGGSAALGTVDDVITGPVLSRLYGATIEVVRLGGRIFVLSGDGAVEPQGHCAPGNAQIGHVHA